MGRKMNWKCVSLLICFVLSFGVVQATTKNVYAATDDLCIAGSNYDSDNDCSGEGWTYVASTHTLTLNGASYNYTGDAEGRPYAAILYSGTEALNIELQGKNGIDGYKVGIESVGTLVLKGQGSLNVNTEDFAINSYQNGIVIESGDISLTALYDGINTNSVTINGGNVKAVGTRCNGMQVVGENAFVKINGGNLIAEGLSGGSGDMSSGIYCYDLLNRVKGDVIISKDSTLIARAGTNVAEQEDYVAIYGNVKNEIAGKGWADYTGTGAATDIAINATGAELTFKKVQFPVEINTTIPVTGVSLDKSTMALTADGSETLTATVAPSNATNSTVTWSSSNQAVATVDGGKVTAVAAGTATITATAGGKSATCTVTVTAASSGSAGTTSVPATTQAPAAADTPKAEGTTVTDSTSKAEVVVTSKVGETPEVEYKSTTDTKAKSVVVSDTVTLDGVTYEVTSVDKNAFSGCVATKATIGKNVETLSTGAFNKSKISTVVIKTKKLTKKSVKNAFKGSKAKSITIKVNVGSKKLNKKYAKLYKKIFTKKNVGKKVKVKY